MAEYIEKQAVMDKFAEVVAPSNHSDFQRAPTWNNAVDIIENFPPADVRPVVRSHWKKNDNGTYSCERCHSWIPEEQRHYANWCLYCGAIMGDEDDN